MPHSMTALSITFKTCYKRHNFMLSVDMLDAVTLSPIMPDVMAPKFTAVLVTSLSTVDLLIKIACLEFLYTHFRYSKQLILTC